MNAQVLRAARFAVALPALMTGWVILSVGIATGEITYALGYTESNGVDRRFEACANPFFGVGELIAGRYPKN